MEKLSSERCDQLQQVLQAASTSFPLNVNIPKLQSDLANRKHQLGAVERMELFKAIAGNLQDEATKPEADQNFIRYSKGLKQALNACKGNGEAKAADISGNAGTKAWLRSAMLLIAQMVWRPSTLR